MTDRQDGFQSERLPRLDGVDKATGRAIYATDVSLPNMLQGKVLRSPHPHARIVAIDTSRAEALPGVHAVITAHDAPNVYYGHAFLVDRVVLARDKVRYVGEPIAAVAADSADQAEEAVRLIEVAYEPLPAVFDIDEALAPDAPLIHEDLASYKTAGSVDRHGNMAAHIVLEQGSIDDGFAAADLLVEEEFRTSAIHQSYLEPHTSVAAVDGSGRVTVWTTTQFPFGVRGDLAQVLQMPLNKLRVVPTVVGGAFGGKLWIFVEPLCVLLARKAGQPVRIEMSYEEEFLAGRPRVACTLHMRTGVKRDGTLVARHVRGYYDSGAYAYVAPGTNGASISRGPYRLPNLRVDTFVVYTNKHSIGAMRGPGGAQMVFAVESHMDTIARQLGMDPLDLRRHNAVTDADFPPVGEQRGRIGFAHTLQRAAQRAGWGSPLTEPGRGRGMACAQWASNAGPSTAYLTIDDDGTVRVLTGAVDLTGSDSIIAQAVAHELGLPARAVQVSIGDTDTVPYTAPTAGSRMTYSMGTVARMAAIDARRQLFALAATRLEVSEDDLTVDDGCVVVRGDQTKRLTFAQLVAASVSTQGPIVASATLSRLAPAPAFITAIADVAVDPDTGLVRLLRFVVAQDVGTALNPLHIEGQIEGGMALGVGQGLLEQIQYQQGEVLNPRFGEYQLPRAEDMPEVLIELVEEPSLEGPYGARGAGEPGAMPGAAAIANAIYAATGARIRELPMTPERVHGAIVEASGT
jgi:xanthine dehydrogenase molybdenum-binding subunit